MKPANDVRDQPVWLEVALNGGWTRKRQPLMPVAIEEIIEEGIACIDAGAAIVHMHSYDATAGHQNHDATTYDRIFQGIRKNRDAIVYPTIAQMPEAPDSEQRLDAMQGLTGGGLLEWAPIDPGSTTFSRFADIAIGRTGYLYANPEAHIRRVLDWSARHRLHPNFSIYEPGFLRLGSALARHTPGLPCPLYRFMFTSDHAYGFPLRAYALDAYLQLLAEEAPGVPWMVAGRGTDVTPMIEQAVRCGGHIRVGLEDAPLYSEVGNVELVRRAAASIRAAGGRLATPAEVRTSAAAAHLGVPAP